MTVSLEKILEALPAERRRRIEQRAAELVAEELTLRELRRLRKLTQTRLSKKLRIGQEGVSRIEKRSDLYLSTLRSYIEALGGRLNLIVEFPDRTPVVLLAFGEENRVKSPGRKSLKGQKRAAGSKPAKRIAA